MFGSTYSSNRAHGGEVGVLSTRSELRVCLKILCLCNCYLFPLAYNNTGNHVGCFAVSRPMCFVGVVTGSGLQHEKKLMEAS